MNDIDVDWHHGDCLDILPKIPDASIDAVITDPPYPEIDRDYGRMTENEWHEMMRSVVAECRRILKPKGSAVFILQPNSERVGRMRPWLWEFMAWTAREWNQVQDAWCWNTTARTGAGTNCKGLMRESLKACVWIGSPDCYRNQDDVLWTESDSNRMQRIAGRFGVSTGPSCERTGTTPIRHDKRRWRTAAESRGGVTPYNVLPIARGGGSGGVHPSSTPHVLCDWWVRYITIPGNTICDPFMGSGTTGRAAIKRGRSFVGIEKFRKHYDLASQILSAEIVRVSHVDHD
jgi:hypothetical protein